MDKKSLFSNAIKYTFLVLLCSMSLGLISCGAANGISGNKASSSDQASSSASASAKTSEAGDEQNTGSSDSPVTVDFIDVGKGDCILISHGDIHIMIDTGYFETSGRVLSYLKRKKVDRLNCLIITHYDKDHVGGAVPIISKVPTDTIYLPGYEGIGAYYEALKDYIEEKHLDAAQVSSDISLDYDMMHLDIYASDISYRYDTVKEEGNDNDVCITAALFFGDDSWLFAGDLETEGIAGFLAANRGPFDVVKMPHHGRKASNTKEFIESTAPMIAVITDSKDEKAKKKVVKWLTEQGANVYSSSVNGDITITGNGHEEYVID